MFAVLTGRAKLSHTVIAQQAAPGWNALTYPAYAKTHLSSGVYAIELQETYARGKGRMSLCPLRAHLVPEVNELA